MNYLIIVAGGSGSRFKSNVPKQFLELSGKPVLMRTIDVFYTFDSSLKVILVLPEQQIAYWKNLCIKYGFHIKHEIVSGGHTRFHSVKNALNMIEVSDELVAIHDGVRPLVSKETIQRCFVRAEAKGNAVPAIAPNDSVRQITGADNCIIDRSQIQLIQTPQVFRIDKIKQAYEQPYQDIFTDDASVLEKKSEKIYLVEGNRENIKITNNIDLIVAEALYTIV